MYPISIHKIEEILTKITLVNKIVRFNTIRNGGSTRRIVQAKIIGIDFEPAIDNAPDEEKYLTICLSTNYNLNVRICNSGNVYADYHYNTVKIESIEVLIEENHDNIYFLIYKQMFATN